jgi:glutamate-1-semialdehyde 2,1-aminomutase
VITGFRVALGGAQARLGVTPDLAVFAKALGGGYPIAAIAGKRQYMELLGGPVLHGGSYNGNTISTSASIATLAHLIAGGDALYAEMERRGTRLMDGLRAVAAETHAPLHVQGIGAAFNTAFGVDGPVTDYRSYARTDIPMQKRWLVALQNHGVRVTSRGTWFLSAVHTDADIDATLSAAERALRDPDLLA